MEYIEALQLQRSLHGEIAEGQRENTLVLVEHPSVYTAGKRTQDHIPLSDLLNQPNSLDLFAKLKQLLLRLVRNLDSQPLAWKVDPESGL